MKDLYKRIGLAGKTDDPGAIIKALNQCRKSNAVKESAEHILLNPKRKEVYDCNYHLLGTIGQIRKNMGLGDTATCRWLQCEDFNGEVPPKRTHCRIHFSWIAKADAYVTRNSSFVLSAIVVLAIVSALLLFFGAGIRETLSQSNEALIENSAAVVEKAPIEFNEPVVDLPENGSIARYHVKQAAVPLEIKTNIGFGHFYVKLIDADTRTVALTVFIHEGESAVMDVPMGNYEMKYAVGTEWYGEAHLFGPDTACSKVEERFEFKMIGEKFSGYTVELYLNEPGNLDTEPITLSQFLNL